LFWLSGDVWAFVFVLNSVFVVDSILEIIYAVYVLFFEAICLYFGQKGPLELVLRFFR
jgi:hypothetical protein